MSKSKSVFICNNCGYESLKWIGRCPSCGEWNSFSEETPEPKGKNKKSGKSEIVPLNSKMEDDSGLRAKLNIKELDRVLGGGMVPGSVILIAGDPGIGKSTLMLQAAAESGIKVLYVTGEESVNQVKMRAERLNIRSDNVFLMAGNSTEVINNAVEEIKPGLIIVDSIQTLVNPEFDNTAGSVTQIRESAASIMDLCKSKNIPAMIVGHVTKEGYVAGPKLLEHMVDAVIQFEGERNYSFRILRSVKNRFGNTNEIGIFEMSDKGLVEVNDPGKLFLSERNEDVPGSSVTAAIEGSRSVLIEVQSLVSVTNFGNPQRVTTGFDSRRLSILLAVLERREGFVLSSQNVFLNIAGGLKIAEPSIDLAVCMAVISSLMNKPVGKSRAVIGEVGLGGEIRSVNRIEKRISEAVKLGFDKIIIPAGNKKGLKKVSAQIEFVETLSEAVKIIFG